MSSVSTVSGQYQSQAATAGADKRADEQDSGDTAQAFIALFHGMLQRVSVNQAPEAGWANLGANKSTEREDAITPREGQQRDTQIALRDKETARQEVKTNEQSKESKTVASELGSEEAANPLADASTTPAEKMSRTVESHQTDKRTAQANESATLAQENISKTKNERAASGALEQLALAETLSNQLPANDGPELVKSAATKEAVKAASEKPDPKVELFMSAFAQGGVEVAGAPEFSLTQGAKTPFAGEGRAAMQLTAQLADVFNGRVLQAAMGDNGGNNATGDNGAKGFASFSNMKELAGGTGKAVAKAALSHQSSQLETINQIKDMLVSAARNKGGASMVVRLDPPELGNVTLKVIQRSDQLHARISAENSDVEDSLRQRVPEIMQLLSSVGFKPENIVVSFGAESSAGANIDLATNADAGGFLSGNSNEQNNNSERGGAKGSPAAAIALAAMNTAADGIPGWIA